MAYCKNCLFYDERYDSFRQDYNDTAEDENEIAKTHYCLMYSDHIPHSIWQQGANCEFYDTKNSGD